ncbi:MAG: hypothetical protein DIU60_000900 [Actinomycetes bacterium]|nr:MAG: hypothetical protein DIU60_12930 [Actinomycetota bacterium]
MTRAARIVDTVDEAVAGSRTAPMPVGGSGPADMPGDLIDALVRQGAEDPIPPTQATARPTAPRC